MLEKYLFNPGDTLPAVNVNSIDPDNIINQQFGKLVGDTDVDLDNFETLFWGDNDGAFKITVDSDTYDNVTPTFVTINEDVTISSETPGALYATGALNKTLSFSTKCRIKSLAFYRNTGSGSGYVEVRLNNSGGDVVATSDALNLSTDGAFTFSGAQQKILEANQNYYFVVVITSGSYTVFSPVNTGGSRPYYVLSGDNADKAYSLTTIATDIQTAIRAETSGEERVNFVTDHFEIESGTYGATSEVLKLEAPTTGTDISGAGYLDLGANATETMGQGDEYKLMRLGAGGSQIQVKSGTLSAPNETITITTGFRVKNVRIFLTQLNGYGSMGGWTEDGGNQCVYFTSGAGNLRTDFCYYHPGNVISGTIENIDDNGFDIVGSVTSNTGYLYWEAN